MHPFDAELVSRKFAEDDRYILKEMAMVHDPKIPTSENQAYIEKSRTLMAEREAQIFGKSKAFDLDTDRGWLPPSEKDVLAMVSGHGQEPAK